MNNDDLKDTLIVDHLKWCGCGSPSDALQFIYKFISLTIDQQARTRPQIDNLEDGSVKDEKILLKEWSDIYEENEEQKKNLVINNWKSVLWIIYYILDEKKIFSHGGNVSGGWLDNHKFFDLLTQWNKNREGQ